MTKPVNVRQNEIYFNMTVEQIAAELGVSRAMVWKILSRALEKVRRGLNARGIARVSDALPDNDRDGNSPDFLYTKIPD